MLPHRLALILTLIALAAAAALTGDRAAACVAEQCRVEGYVFVTFPVWGGNVIGVPPTGPDVDARVDASNAPVKHQLIR